MLILIIEDEPLAAERLESLVRRQFGEVRIDGPLDTVAAAEQYFRKGSDPDLIFMDVQLADGISFELFDRMEIRAPVIFTTAYDAYALRAFKVNSIDYLLKPVDEEELAAAAEKYRRLKHMDAGLAPAALEAIRQALNATGPSYKSRFVVREGDHLRTVDTGQVAYFYSMHKGTWLVDAGGRKHLIDQTLEQLEILLDPERFFRINRKFIVSLSAAGDIVAWSNSRLKLVLKPPAEEEAIVARDRVKDFRSWLEG